jgi:hypothetical protein
VERIRSTSSSGFLPIPAGIERERKQWSAGYVVAFAAFLTFGSGCATNKLWKNDSDNNAPLGVPPAPMTAQQRPESNQVVQASATTPASTTPTNNSFAWFTGKNGKSQVSEIALGWRSWIDYLPDPTRDGMEGPGLAGQMFLFGPGLQSVDADGTLIVELYDETPRPPGQPGNVPERWSFDKDTLNKKMRTVDERFGKCFVIFLPWPTYRPDVTKVRITARYQTEGKLIIPEEWRITISSNPKSPILSSSSETMYGPQGLQQAGALSLMGSASPSGLGMGTLSPGGFSPNGMNAGAMPLGVIGSLPSGAPLSSRPASDLPGSNAAMPISGASMNNVTMSNFQGQPMMPAQQGTFPAPPAATSATSPYGGGLTPIGSTPQGLPPFAFQANPLGR